MLNPEHQNLSGTPVGIGNVQKVAMGRFGLPKECQKSNPPGRL
jgi:hypothetical protein